MGGGALKAQKEAWAAKERALEEEKAEEGSLRTGDDREGAVVEGLDEGA